MATVMRVAVALLVSAILFSYLEFNKGSHYVEDDLPLLDIPVGADETVDPTLVLNMILKSISDDYIRSNGMVESGLNQTTSESQSYGMLIAVASSNQTLFDSVWEWTKSNLQTRPRDKLFSWLWENGKVRDINPATDADQDIAYALYLANKKWGDSRYLDEARLIVNDIWDIETGETNGVRYVGAGNWAIDGAKGIVINPSYLSPYQYRIFSMINLKHDWHSIVDSSYRILDLCSGSLGLAMDWCKIDSAGNLVKNFKFEGRDGSVYSYDALRVPYRIAMDYLLNNEPRALEYLKRNEVFAKDWKKHGKIFAQYSQSGGYIGQGESLASYGAQLASFSITDKTIASEIFNTKIYPINSWTNKDFYDMSWVYFGLNFYIDYLKQREEKIL